jgi:hypothetical protein
MRTSIKADFISDLECMVVERPEDETVKRMKDKLNQMFILCELIPIIAEIELGSSSESVNSRLLRTSFFAEEKSEESEIKIFSDTFEEASKAFYSQSGYQLVLTSSIKPNEAKLLRLFGKDGVFPTSLFYKMMFEHLLVEIRQTTRNNGDDVLEVELSVTGKSLILKMKSRSTMRSELSMQKPIYLFNYILQYIGLGKISFSLDGEYNVVELMADSI